MNRQLQRFKQCQEALRIIHMLLPYLTHDAGCSYVKGKTHYQRACDCEYSKLYQRATRLRAAIHKIDEEDHA